MNKTEAIIPLTSIRGFAALFVVWYHIAMSFTKQDFWFFHLFVNGDLSVDLFFVLSGFILHHVYKDKNIYQNYKNFILNRIARIYPLHIITLFFLLILITLDQSVANNYKVIFSSTSFLLNLILVQNWGFIPPSWNMVSWSISAEWFMYLLFPFMMYFSVFFKFNQKPLIYFFFSILLLSIYYLIICFFKLEGYGGISLGGMIRVFFEFSLGFCIYGLRVLLLKYRNINHSTLITALLCLGLISTLIWQNLLYLFLPISAVVILNLSMAENKISHVFEKKICVWLGEISYSLYMWHWIVIQILNYLIFKNIIKVEGKLGMFIYFVVVTALSIIIAHFSHKYIEVKGQKFFKSLS